MKIGIDARMAEHTGIGRYIRSLADALLKTDDRNRYVLFGDKEVLEEHFSGRGADIERWEAPVYSLKEQNPVPLRGKGLDLMHFPHFNFPLLYPGKKVVTVHDLIHLVDPGKSFTFPAKACARFMIYSALCKADKVIAVSRSTREDLLRMFGARFSDKIKVIYEAADASFSREEDPEVLKTITEKYSLGKDFILYVGNVKPHKNIETLFSVYEKLRQWGDGHQLVVVGRWDRRMDRLRKKLGSPGIKYLGEVPPGELVSLYSIAGVLLHLSFYEGFGLTILEAMRCGCPVVTTAVSSLPEVAGKASFYVSPVDVGQIADTVYNVLSHPEYRKEMTKSGLERAGSFSWERAAGSTLELYRSVIKKPGVGGVDV